MLDSLSFLKGFTPASGLRLLDMGSGAGFPGLPIKIAHPEIFVTLVESTKKKASFLRHIIRTLKLTGTEVLDTRTEELADKHLSSCDIVTARAFADIRSAIIAALPLLKPGGLLVLSRGPEETVNDKDITGISLEKKVDLTLPHSEHKRAIWVFRKRT
jgi:16S rRNA (guanine527-N7)-methyltransferase